MWVNYLHKNQTYSSWAADRLEISKLNVTEA